MSSSATVRKYPLRIPAEVASEVDRVVAKSHASFNFIVLSCIRAGLAEVDRSLSKKEGRVTNVEPWPEDEARRFYSQPDELDGVTGEQLRTCQSQREPT
jgi:hypothetical protein